MFFGRLKQTLARGGACAVGLGAALLGQGAELPVLRAVTESLAHLLLQNAPQTAAVCSL